MAKCFMMWCPDGFDDGAQPIWARGRDAAIEKYISTMDITKKEFSADYKCSRMQPFDKYEHGEIPNAVLFEHGLGVECSQCDEDYAFKEQGGLYDNGLAICAGCLELINENIVSGGEDTGRLRSGQSEAPQECADASPVAGGEKVT